MLLSVLLDDCVCSSLARNVLGHKREHFNVVAHFSGGYLGVLASFVDVSCKRFSECDERF